MLPKRLWITDIAHMGGSVSRAIHCLEHALADQEPNHVLVQLRAKELPIRDLVQLVDRAVAIIRQASQLVVVNERYDIARLMGAHGIHLPGYSFPVSIIRHFWPTAIIGQACHQPTEIIDMQKDPTLRPDYLTWSPVFPTPSKPGQPALGLASLRSVQVPGVCVYALGGMQEEHLPLVEQMGAHGIALIRNAWN